LHLNYFTNSVFEGLAGQDTFMVSPAAVEKNGEEWARWNPVGTGPFKFVEYERDVKLVATRFDDYWQEGKPYLDGIEVIVLPDHMTRQMAFQAGDLDIAYLEGKLAGDLMALGFEARELTRALPVHCLVPSSANPESPWSSKKVREAAWYAIDREKITDALGYRQKVVSNQWIPTGVIGHIPELETLRIYDQDKARQLLTEAGYPNGFKSRLIVGPRWVDRDLQVAVQAELAAVGIDVELEFPEQGKYSEYRWAESGWGDGILFQEFAQFATPTPSVRFYWDRSPAQLYDMLYPEGFDELVDELLATPEFSKDLLEEFNRALFEDATLIPLYEIKKIAFAKAGVHGDRVFSYGFLWDWTPRDAWIEESAR